MPIKGTKSQRNVPELYDELKRQRSISLTDTGVKSLDLLAKSFRLSRSEFIEKISRGEILTISLENDEMELLNSIAQQHKQSVSEFISLAIKTLIQNKINI